MSQLEQPHAAVQNDHLLGCQTAEGVSLCRSGSGTAIRQVQKSKKEFLIVVERALNRGLLIEIVWKGDRAELVNTPILQLSPSAILARGGGLND